MEKPPQTNTVSEQDIETPSKPKNYLVGSLTNLVKAAAVTLALGNSSPAWSNDHTVVAKENTQNVSQLDNPKATTLEEIVVKGFKSRFDPDPLLLVFQQQNRDLQESGEFKIENAKQKARGFRFPHDPGYDPLIDEAPGLGGPEDMQQVMIEGATPEQLNNWREYMADKSGWAEKQRRWAEENKEGRRE